MPIRPENKDRYPKNWPEIRAAVLKRADNRCEWCWVPNHAVGYRDEKGVFHIAAPEDHAYKSLRINLTVMHLDHTPENCDLSNLKAACEQCHNRYDAPVRASNRQKRLRREYETHQMPLLKR